MTVLSRRGAVTATMLGLTGVGGMALANANAASLHKPPPGKGKPTKTPTVTPSSTPTPTVTPTGATWQTMLDESFSAGLGNWKLCQWSGRNSACPVYPSAGEPVSIVNGAVRFELDPKAPPPFGTNPRAEIAEPLGSTLYVHEGEEWRFAWDMMFDPNFATPVGNWCIPWQWHGSGGTSSPPLCLDLGTDDVVYLANNNSIGYLRKPVMRVPRDGWHRWEVHTIFSASTGYAEVLVDGVVLLPWHARKTMVAGESYNYFKCGLYESAQETAKRVVWHDNPVWSKRVS